MFKRQKSLLCLLHYAGGNASRLMLVKWCFLLANETESRGGDYYYDFLPYYYGPYSFTLRHEIDSLIKNGFISNFDERYWVLTMEAGDLINSTPLIFHQEAKVVIYKYGKLDESSLLKSVYNRYPYFTINSKKKEIQKLKLPVANNAVYTIGYEGLSVESFFNKLLRSGIKSIIDVRRNPIARRYGFHKKTLSKLCDLMKITYEHIPELGIPSNLRCDIKTNSDYKALLEHYDRYILANNPLLISYISDFVKSKPAAIMCMESDPKNCHRSRIAASVSNISKLPVSNL